jgi:hypothetical protein
MVHPTDPQIVVMLSEMATGLHREVEEHVVNCGHCLQRAETLQYRVPQKPIWAFGELQSAPTIG